MTNINTPKYSNNHSRHIAVKNLAKIAKIVIIKV